MKHKTVDQATKRTLSRVCHYYLTLLYKIEHNLEPISNLEWARVATHEEIVKCLGYDYKCKENRWLDDILHNINEYCRYDDFDPDKTSWNSHITTNLAYVILMEYKYPGTYLKEREESE